MEKVKRKNGLKYREKVYFNNKCITSPWFNRKQEAKVWKREKLLERDRINALGISYIPDITLNEFLEIFIINKQGLAKRTIDGYASCIKLYIKPNLGHVKLSKIRLQHGETLKVSLLKTGLSVTRVNNILNVMKIIFKEAVRTENLLKSPFNNLKFIPKQERTLDYWLPTEVHKFLYSSLESHYYPVYLVCLNTGLRKGEICGLFWDCIDFKNRQIIVKRTVDRYGLKESTKSKKVRNIPMNDTVYEFLHEHFKNRQSLKYVFTTPHGKPIDYQHFTFRIFNRDMEKAKVRSIRFHDLRTTFASNFCMNGGDIYALSKILGHSSVEITQQKYAHLHPSFMEREINILNFSPELELQNFKVL